MVEIIPDRPKRSSVGERLMQGVGAFSEYQQQQQQQQQLAKQNEAIKKQYGVDLSGITDPNERKAILIEQLKGKSKENLFEKKKGFLNEIFNGNQQGNSLGQQLSQGGEPQEGQELNPNQGYDPLQISDEQIAQATAVDPTIGRELRSAKDSALRERKTKQDFELKSQKASPEYQRSHQLSSAQATADVSYNKDLQAASKQHDIKSKTLDRLEDLNKKGVTGKPYEKLLEKFGLIAQTSEGRREFAADVKNLITDIRSILGSQFSQFEFQTILNAYPSADFSKGANEAIIRNLKEFQDIRHQEFVIANELKKENKGKLPEDFQSKVNDRLQDYAKSRLSEIKKNTQEIMKEQLGVPAGHTVMIAPDGGILSVPYEEVDEVIRNGGSLP